QLARQMNVPIENRTDLIPDGVPFLILQEHRVEGRNGAAIVVAATLEQTRQRGEHGGRIPPSRGPLTHCQPNITHPAGESRHRGEKQRSPATLIAKILGDGGPDISSPTALERRTVRRRDDDYTFAQTLRAQVVFNEFPDFAAALADQYYHIHIRRSAG